MNTSSGPTGLGAAYRLNELNEMVDQGLAGAKSEWDLYDCIERPGYFIETWFHLVQEVSPARLLMSRVSLGISEVNLFSRVEFTNIQAM